MGLQGSLNSQNNAERIAKLKDSPFLISNIKHWSTGIWTVTQMTGIDLRT